MSKGMSDFLFNVSLPSVRVVDTSPSWLVSELDAAVVMLNGERSGEGFIERRAGASSSSNQPCFAACSDSTEFSKEQFSLVTSLWHSCC